MGVFISALERIVIVNVVYFFLFGFYFILFFLVSQAFWYFIFFAYDIYLYRNHRHYTGDREEFTGDHGRG